MKTINVARDFSKFPGGRHKVIGDGSGEEFREKFLVPALKHHQKLVVELDGVAGYPPSFLEEAFGGLVRLGFSETEIWSNINLKTGVNYEVYKVMAENYVRAASERN